MRVLILADEEQDIPSYAGTRATAVSSSNSSHIPNQFFHTSSGQRLPGSVRGCE